MLDGSPYLKFYKSIAQPQLNNRQHDIVQAKVLGGAYIIIINYSIFGFSGCGAGAPRIFFLGLRLCGTHFMSLC